VFDEGVGPVKASREEHDLPDYTKRHLPSKALWERLANCCVGSHLTEEGQYVFIS